jgi:hypothetical protein
MLGFGSPSAEAAASYAVSVSATSDPVSLGDLAIFRVRVEGQTASLPSFDFDVEGGRLAAVASIDPTAANIAEGTVFVTRETPGTAQLRVRLGNEVLATGQVRFAAMGKVNVRVSLDAGPDAAARTWRYEVVSATGSVVGSLTANTSGDSPVNMVTSGQLPYGQYTIRQVLGNDTRTACAAGTFYRVAAAEAAIELSSPQATANFTIFPCPDLPAGISVQIPVDTIAPPAGVVGDADVFPGETPVSEVRGAREEGPGNVLPPSVGNTLAESDQASSAFTFLFVFGAVATLVPAAAWSVVALTKRLKR